MSASNSIQIKNASIHNLKGISLSIPRNKWIVITGLSGSGKSSLAFDTLYAEGQRRYVESLSAYARQFMGRINKPEVEYIKGIPPAIAIEQKVNTRNPRSTVGTSTEIYDYIKLLYARAGKTFSPISGKEVKRHSVGDVVEAALNKPEGTRFLVLSPVHIPEGRTRIQHLETLQQQGFSRLAHGAEVHKIEELLFDTTFLDSNDEFWLVIDRLSNDQDAENVSRMADSIQTAFFEGHGSCQLRFYFDDKIETELFSNRFEADGITFELPTTDMFSFNNPLGACPTCEGYGKVIGLDVDLVIPNKSLSIYEGAIACWKGDKLSYYKDQLIKHAAKFDFPIHRPYYELSESQQELLWTGNRYFTGLTEFFNMLEAENYKIQNRVMLARYRGKTTCPECKGTRLKKEAQYVKIGGKSISDLVNLPIDQLKTFFDQIELDAHQAKIAQRLLVEIINRINFLVNVGLNYLTLNRLSSTLSGGESQRINLATSLGSSLVGSLYILDEPSIGLHARDTHLLIEVLRKLQQLGNTVLVVEHDEEIIRAADEVIDIGPLAGRLGGEVVFQGALSELVKAENSLTADYLTGRKSIPLPDKTRKWNQSITLTGARENNLKNLTVSIPLKVLTVVTGVSGSGKSTLIKRILYPALKKRFGGYSEQTGSYDKLTGDLHLIKEVEFVDQNPIGKSSRSNPVTYLKAYDEIRKLFAAQQLAKMQGFTASHFSFNIDGGRCDECQGEGSIQIEMQFMADVKLTCESCKGKRFKDEVLEVNYRGKNIHDILELTVEEAIEFFGKSNASTEKKIVQRLKPLQEVGLSYVKLGQSSSTLSGGESQRVKLASFLAKDAQAGQYLFIFDEPTTGLHFHDVHVLLKAFQSLIDLGNTILIIEHNQEVIKSADWVIDLGPEGGEQGGDLLFAGTPKDLLACEKSYTAQFLKSKMFPK